MNTDYIKYCQQDQVTPRKNKQKKDLQVLNAYIKKEARLKLMIHIKK